MSILTGAGKGFLKKRAIILAGGEGSRLGVLTIKRTKPAVPFAGKYRIIDFTLSNCVNSQIFDVMILAQYRPHSLVRHIGAGRPWDLDRSFTTGIQIYQPYQVRRGSCWYMGTADAVYQNLDFIKRENPNMILILSGDHVYQMNYSPMINFHHEHRADVTVSTLEVPLEEAHRFGVLTIDKAHRVTGFLEKPKEPTGTLASMGIYAFDLATLEQILEEDSRDKESHHDFGKNIIPKMVQEGYRVFAYPYQGYWVDVGTIEAYWQTHMDLLRNPAPLDLNARSWIVHTRSEERPPVFIQKGAVVSNSLVTDGCVILSGAIVEKSVLSPGVYIEPGAVIRESVIFNDCYIKEGAQIERAILDKNVTIGCNARIGEIPAQSKSPEIASIGKGSLIPDGLVMGRGATVGCDVGPKFFDQKIIDRGKAIGLK